MYLVVVLCILLLLAYYKIQKCYRFWQDQKVLCSKPTPFVGHVGKLLLGKQSFFDFTTWLYNEFPEKRYNGYFQFLKPVLLVKDLDLIKKICIKDFEHFYDHLPFGDEKMDPVLYRSLLNLKGQEWREMRNSLSPAFTSRKMRGMFIFMCENSDNFTEYLLNRKEEIVEEDLRNLFYKFTNDVIMSAVFGVSRNTFEDPKNVFYEMGMFAVKYFAGFQVILSQISPSLYKLFRCKIFPDKVVDFFSNLVRDNIQQREKYNIVRPDMIHLLMEAQKGRTKYETAETEVDTGFATAQESQLGRGESSRKIKLTHNDIVGQALLFFLAGFETVATVSSMICYELALNPDIQRKLQAEIFESLEKCNGQITYEELLSMKYLDQVLSETLRKWPPGFQMQRTCVKDYDIPPVTGDEPLLTVKRGQDVIIPVSGIHRDPKYFPDPLRFDPDRFNEENKSKIIPGSYMPFGVGPRNCIGSRFALLEVKVLLFHLLQKFDIVPIKKTPATLQISPKQFAIAPKDGLWLGLRARN